MRTTWTMIFAAILLSISTVADSEEYQLFEGTQEVCNAYEKNRKSQ